MRLVIVNRKQFNAIWIRLSPAQRNGDNGLIYLPAENAILVLDDGTYITKLPEGEYEDATTFVLSMLKDLIYEKAFPAIYPAEE